jgi:hypothetical protein
MSDHVKLKILLGILSPKCPHHSPHHKYVYGPNLCLLKPENEDDPSKRLTQCGGDINECEVEEVTT